MWLVVLATIFIAALIYKIIFAKSPNILWKYGIPEIDISQGVNKMDILSGRTTLWIADDYAYTEMAASNLKYCGITGTDGPTVIIRDLDLVKKVLIKDFDYFVNRREFFTKADGCLNLMMSSLKGDEWKGVRASVSPTFTTGKIRRMMDSLNLVGKEWVEEFTTQAKRNSGCVTIDALSAVNQYTVQAISTAVFGMHADVIKNPNSKFAQMANRLTNFNSLSSLKTTIRMNFPSLAKIFGICFVDTQAISYFEEILKDGLKARMADTTTKSDDYLQLLVEAKKGEVKGVGTDELSSFEKEALIEGHDLAKKQYLTDDIITAQSVAFFFGGFSTTSNLVTFTLYALALYDQCQNRLREEVGKAIKKDGTLDYDDVAQMVYLDMVICEVLRKFSATTRIERVCTRGYRDSETGLAVPKGILVAIPINAIHHDKQYYDNPESFDPEHFSPENKANRSPYAYLPFGTGPRNCVATRFALIKAKSVVAYIVHHFRIEPTDKTPVPFQGKPGGFNYLPPTDLELRLIPTVN